MESKKITKMLLMRLPTYLNYLKSLPESRENISATKVANALGLGEVMVRKDLAKVSSGGRRKVGYVCKDLISAIESFMNRTSAVRAVVVGVEKLGLLLLDNDGLAINGLDVVAGFEGEEQNTSEGGKNIYPITELEDFCLANDIQVGIITGSIETAQSYCNRLNACGIKAIWNFVPIHLDVADDVIVQNENLSFSLMSLFMKMENQEKEGMEG